MFDEWYPEDDIDSCLEFDEYQVQLRKYYNELKWAEDMPKYVDDIVKCLNSGEIIIAKDISGYLYKVIGFIYRGTDELCLEVIDNCSNVLILELKDLIVYINENPLNG